MVSLKHGTHPGLADGQEFEACLSDFSFFVQCYWEERKKKRASSLLCSYSLGKMMALVKNS